MKLVQSNLERLFEEKVLHKDHKKNFDYVNRSDDEKEKFQHDMKLEETKMRRDFLEIIAVLNEVDSTANKVFKDLEAKL